MEYIHGNGLMAAALMDIASRVDGNLARTPFWLLGITGVQREDMPFQKAVVNCLLAI